MKQSIISILHLIVLVSFRGYWIYNFYDLSEIVKLYIIFIRKQ